MVRLKIIFFLIITLVIGCTPKMINCDIFDARIIVKEKVEMDLPFKKQLILTESEFESLLLRDTIQNLVLDSIKHKLMSPDDFKDIPMISTYNEGGVYGDIVVKWEDYKGRSLKDALFYYLGTHNLGQLKLSLVLFDSQNSETQKNNRALYMITEGQSQKWVIPVAMSVAKGMYHQRVSSTYKEKSNFIYKDYSEPEESVCAKYKISDSGEIVVLTEEFPLNDE